MIWDRSQDICQDRDSDRTMETNNFVVPYVQLTDHLGIQSAMHLNYFSPPKESMSSHGQ